jgi:hypothetical protein
MRSTLVVCSIFSLISLMPVAHADDLLTGDKRLACEAIMCLASSTRPSECDEALKRYFGIHFKKWSDTVKGRANFLNQCPKGDADEKTRSLTDALSKQEKH